MRRRASDGRPRGAGKAILVGDASRFSEADAQARIALRLMGEDPNRDLDGDQSLMIDAVADQFQDALVSAGCIKGGKLRRDRLHVRLFLLRHITGLPPRRMDQVLGLGDRYLRFALDRGRRLVEAARHDGRLEAALDQLNHQHQGDDAGRS